VKVNNSNIISNDDCYFCYSLNLHRFLKDDKQIYHINCGVNKKTNKMWFTYLKTDFLDKALHEWQFRKLNNNYYIERKVAEYAKDET
jgi:hypothetical protein